MLFVNNSVLAPLKGEKQKGKKGKWKKMKNEKIQLQIQVGEVRPVQSNCHL